MRNISELSQQDIQDIKDAFLKKYMTSVAISEKFNVKYPVVVNIIDAAYKEYMTAKEAEAGSKKPIFYEQVEPLTILDFLPKSVADVCRTDLSFSEKIEKLGL